MGGLMRNDQQITLEGYEKQIAFFDPYTLLKKNELENLGYEIARDRNDEILTLWFRRKDSADANILPQFWSQGGGKTLWQNGKKIGRFVRREDWSDSFFIDQLFFENSDEISRPKILPQTQDAVEVEMEVELLPGKLHFRINLYSGAKLYITYDQLDKTVITREYCQDYYIDVDKTIDKIKGQITLVTPSLQSKKFLEKAGIDFEKLKGNFIRRDDPYFISGVKEFNCKVKNIN